jgi:hypothetical protein
MERRRCTLFTPSFSESLRHFIVLRSSVHKGQLKKIQHVKQNYRNRSASTMRARDGRFGVHGREQRRRDGERGRQRSYAESNELRSFQVPIQECAATPWEEEVVVTHNYTRHQHHFIPDTPTNNINHDIQLSFIYHPLLCFLPFSPHKRFSSPYFRTHFPVLGFR